MKNSFVCLVVCLNHPGITQLRNIGIFLSFHSLENKKKNKPPTAQDTQEDRTDRISSSSSNNMNTDTNKNKQQQQSRSLSSNSNRSGSKEKQSKTEFTTIQEQGEDDVEVEVEVDVGSKDTMYKVSTHAG